MPVPSAYCANALAGGPNRREMPRGKAEQCPNVSPEPARRDACRPAAARPLRRVRMLTTGRWHPPLDARLMPTVIAVGAAEPRDRQERRRLQPGGVDRGIWAAAWWSSISTFGRRASTRLFGVKSPDGGLQGWLERKRDRRDEPAQQTRVRNLRLLPSPLPVADAAGSAGLSDLGLRDQRLALVRELTDLDSDVDPRRPRRGQSRRPVRLLRHVRGPSGGHVARAARAAGDIRVPEERGASRGTQARRGRPRRPRAAFRAGWSAIRSTRPTRRRPSTRSRAWSARTSGSRCRSSAA